MMVSTNDSKIVKHIRYSDSTNNTANVKQHKSEISTNLVNLAPFGRTKKTINENINCYHKMVIKFIATKIEQRKKVMSKFKKYFDRVMCQLKMDDEQQHKIVVTHPSFVDATYSLFMESGSIDFELRKEISELFKLAAKVVNQDGESIVLEMLKKDGRLILLRNFLQLDNDFLTNGMIGCMGTVLRFFARFQDYYSLFLDIDAVKKLFQMIGSPNVCLSSEGEEIINALLFTHINYKKEIADKKSKDILNKRIRHIPQFLTKVYDNLIEFFIRIKDCNNYIYKRFCINIFFRIFRENSYKNIQQKFINDKENLKIVMNFQSNENSAIRFEACLLFSIFLINYESITNKDVQVILGKNKVVLAQVINRIDLSEFDESNDYNIATDELILILKKLPNWV